MEQDSLQQIRNNHLADILCALRTKGDCSLAELTECTDGGLTTVKKCVFQAMDFGMIVAGRHRCVYVRPQSAAIYSE